MLLLISFVTELGCVLSKLTNVDINEGEISFVLKQANTDRYLPTWTDLKKQNVKRSMSIRPVGLGHSVCLASRVSPAQKI